MNRILALALVPLSLALAACGGAPGSAGNPTPVYEMSPSLGGGTATPPPGGTSAAGVATGVQTTTPAATADTNTTAVATGTGAAGAGAVGSGKTTKVTLGLGFRPNVQFAPFYLAAQKGYYRDEGLDVAFEHPGDTDLLKLTAAGRTLDYAVASGDEMLVARSQGAPLVYTGAYFHRYPVALIAREDSGVERVEQLKGKTVGVPGLFGATYTGLKALLSSAGLAETDVTVRSVGFTQADALQQKQVDAVMGYLNNEPLQLRRRGVAVRTFPVYESTDLVSNGIITNEENLAQNREQVAALVRASMRGLRDAIADPEAALGATLEYVPEAGGENRETSLEVLRASIPLWRSEAARANGLGYTEPSAWESTRDFLTQTGALAEGAGVLQGAYTNDFALKE